MIYTTLTGMPIVHSPINCPTWVRPTPEASARDVDAAVERRAKGAEIAIVPLIRYPGLAARLHRGTGRHPWPRPVQGQ